jgi:uroporphyrinogen decarboxylase
MAAIRLARRELDDSVPLIGFSGSPWTLATYMVEGQSSKEFARTKTLMFDDPRHMHQLLEKLADAVTAYLNAQIAAGAQALMLFDTWGGILTPRDYREFSLHYMHRILDGLDRGTGNGAVPAVLFTKGGGAWLEDIAATGCDAVGLDWTVDIGEARARIGDRAALQGNLDPGVLYASPDRIREKVAAVLESYGNGPGHVFNLGHGIHPEIDPGHVAVMIEAVHELSRPYHE